MESDVTCHANSAEEEVCSDFNVIYMEEDTKQDVSALLAVQISDLSGALLDHTYARSAIYLPDGKQELKEEDSMVNDVNWKSLEKSHSFKKNKNGNSDTSIQNHTGISETVFPQDDMEISETIYSNIQIESNPGELYRLKQKCNNKTSNEFGIINKCNEIRSMNSISTREREINDNTIAKSVSRKSFNSSFEEMCDSKNPTENSNSCCDSRNSLFRKFESTPQKSEDIKPNVSSLASAQSNIIPSSNIRIEIGGVMVKEEDIKPDVTSLLPVVSVKETDPLYMNHTTNTTAENDKASKVVNSSMLKPFGCNVCGETYASLSCLKIHARTHGSEKPLVCKICGAKFIRKSLFVEHKNSHSYMKTNLKSYLQRIPKQSEV